VIPRGNEINSLKQKQLKNINEADQLTTSFEVKQSDATDIEKVSARSKFLVAASIAMGLFVVYQTAKSYSQVNDDLNVDSTKIGVNVFQNLIPRIDVPNNPSSSITDDNVPQDYSQRVFESVSGYSYALEEDNSSWSASKIITVLIASSGVLIGSMVARKIIRYFNTEQSVFATKNSVHLDESDESSDELDESSDEADESSDEAGESSGMLSIPSFEKQSEVTSNKKDLTEEVDESKHQKRLARLQNFSNGNVFEFSNLKGIITEELNTAELERLFSDLNVKKMCSFGEKDCSDSIPFFDDLYAKYRSKFNPETWFNLSSIIFSFHSLKGENYEKLFFKIKELPIKIKLKFLESKWGDAPRVLKSPNFIKFFFSKSSDSEAISTFPTLLKIGKSSLSTTFWDESLKRIFGKKPDPQRVKMAFNSHSDITPKLMNILKQAPAFLKKMNSEEWIFKELQEQIPLQDFVKVLNNWFSHHVFKKNQRYRDLLNEVIEKDCKKALSIFLTNSIDIEEKFYRQIFSPIFEKLLQNSLGENSSEKQRQLQISWLSKELVLKNANLVNEWQENILRHGSLEQQIQWFKRLQTFYLAATSREKFEDFIFHFMKNVKSMDPFFPYMIPLLDRLYVKRFKNADPLHNYLSQQNQHSPQILERILKLSKNKQKFNLQKLKHEGDSKLAIGFGETEQKVSIADTGKSEEDTSIQTIIEKLVQEKRALKSKSDLQGIRTIAAVLNYFKNLRERAFRQKPLLFPQYTHSTTKKGLEGILSDKKIKVQAIKLFNGAWTSVNREKQYGPYCIVMNKNINEFSTEKKPASLVIEKGRLVWVGFKNDILLNCKNLYSSTNQKTPSISHISVPDNEVDAIRILIEQKNLKIKVVPHSVNDEILELRKSHLPMELPKYQDINETP